MFTPADRAGHAMLDLFALNRLQLVGAGVPARAIERVGGCTPATRATATPATAATNPGQMLHFIRVR